MARISERFEYFKYAFSHSADECRLNGLSFIYRTTNVTRAFQMPVIYGILAVFFFFNFPTIIWTFFFVPWQVLHVIGLWIGTAFIFYVFATPVLSVFLFYIFYIGFLSETGWLILSANLVWPKAGQPLGVAASCDCSTTTALFALSTSLPATWKYRLSSVSWTLLAGIIKQMSFFEPKTQGVAVLKVLTTLFFLM